MNFKGLIASAAAAALVSLPIGVPANPVLGASQVFAQNASVSISIFFDQLRPHGTWVSHPRYRYVWVPTIVDADWEPYTNGRWLYTERYGWYFASDEPFAWAVYHYGRWAFDPEIGWFWVPGTVWAPAWVSWRRGEEHIGWAPLPPADDGFAVSVQISTAEPPRGYWVFVPVRQFLAPRLEVVIVERTEVVVLFERTEILGPVVVQNNIVINNVIDIDFIEQATGEEVTATEVRVVDDPAEAAGEGVVAAFEGELAEPADNVAPPEVVEPAEVDAPTEGQQVEAADDEALEPESPDAAAPADGEQPDATTEPGQETEDEAPAAEEPTPDTPAADAPQTEEPAATEEPAGQPPAEEAPAAGAPDTEETPDGAPPADESQQAPAGQAPAEQAPEEEEEVPAETEEPAQEAPEATPTDEAPSADDTPAAEEPAEECAPEDRAAERC